MKIVMVRYKVRADAAAENERLVKEVFAELERQRPAGIHYSTFKARDGQSFVHLAHIDTADGTNPLLAVEAFKRFSGTIKDRCEEPPATTELDAVARYPAAS
jgi:hypothetical protein